MSYYGAAAHFSDYLERARMLQAGCDADTLCVHSRVLGAREHDALPLVGLRRRAGSTRHAFDLLMVAAFATVPPAVAELVAIVARSPESRLVALAELSPLVEQRLLSIVDGRVHVDARVTGFLRGSRAADPRLAGVMSSREVAPITVDPTPVAIVARELGQHAPLVIEGPAGIGKTTVLVAAAAQRGKTTLIVDLDACDAEQLALARREALLQDAVLVLQTRTPGLRKDAHELVQEGLAVLTTRDGSELVRTLRGARRIRIGLPPVSLRQRIWSSLLPAAASELVTFDLCVRYPLSPGAMGRTAQIAHELADGREITLAHLERAAAQLSPAGRQVMPCLGQVSPQVSA